MTMSPFFREQGSSAVADPMGNSWDEEIWSILRHQGLLELLDAGVLRCHVTGVPLTRENVGGIVGTPTGPKLIADTHEWGGRTAAGV